ncbi:hypothetical protein BFW01_g782 [Lasiodiplodia theobromae]|uniref:Uncharacterized protein n=1 Tax=Lasiodiplodia theobromae TaxID=45133 RepID=A0A5N5DLH3_9PEZI|nr:uncharacterized protein LTHEOB_3780 [Lasiodiplodia theobromae]KAB2578181.1 hypothetical protein DBV05_g3171 [Lasiodiplodia theobromae]KAF4534167.1 hypothetical protein LTHEOB_3780 [Lasiodiplodia theobromae]KAF9641422.1 hypothetical protein BFW01_g782 [Lasiodiplodia theobromae]
MADSTSTEHAAAADRRTQSERAMEHLEWLGGQLHPLEQTILLNNLEKFMKDSDNMVARIKRGERPADVFASDEPTTRPGPPPTELDAGPSRRRRLSSGQSRALNGSASASSTSSEAARRGLLSPEQGAAPANPRKRAAE